MAGRWCEKKYQRLKIKYQKGREDITTKGTKVKIKKETERKIF